jgi:hypothetical protein
VRHRIYKTYKPKIPRLADLAPKFGKICLLSHEVHAFQYWVVIKKAWQVPSMAIKKSSPATHVRIIIRLLESKKRLHAELPATWETPTDLGKAVFVRFLRHGMAYVSQRNPKTGNI